MTKFARLDSSVLGPLFDNLAASLPVEMEDARAWLQRVEAFAMREPIAAQRFWAEFLRLNERPKEKRGPPL